MIIYIKAFLSVQFGSAVWSRDRHRRNVMVRRMMIRYFRFEKKYTLQFIGEILGLHHAAVIHYLREVHDPEQVRFEMENLPIIREKFERMENVLKENELYG